MKSNKVLLGLFAGLLALTGGAAKAQMHEVGPANIGGHVSSIVVDRTDSAHTTLYAGAISGGLYVRTDNADLLRTLYAESESSERIEQMAANTDSWHLLRYTDADGYERNLPVSALTQLPDGTVIVGTGDNTYNIGSTYDKMSTKGCGIFRYNPTADTKYQLIPYTAPTSNQLFGAVRALDFYVDGTTTYLFAATNTGLYRWTINSESDWSSNATRIGDNMSVDQLVIMRNLNMAYFTSGNRLFRIGNLTATNAIDVTSSNSAFGSNSLAIKLAVAPSDNRYLYAMVIGSNGLMQNIYVTTNSQVWYPIATSSVLPLTYNNGLNCGALAVDPGNPKRIVVAGTNIWTGEGFIEGAIYQWTKNSYSEFELNSGDFMSSVFNNAVYVHSGIHQIVSDFRVVDGEGVTTYYMVTDGGVFSTNNEFVSYNNINRGMNNMQINSVAVCPDGSIISGANNSACPFIEARLDHFGGTAIPAWYDDGSLGNMNHDANILWSGNGGKVAASAFQQISTQNIRNIFVSSANGNFGRAKADYLDFTNNQTWTMGNAFLTSEMVGGPTIGNISLWENANDSCLRDSIKVGFDMGGTYTDVNGNVVEITSANQTIPNNAKVTFLCKGNSDYPFEYTLTKSQKASDSLVVKNPIVARLLTIANTSATQTSVMYTWMPNDFSKIYDSVIDADRNLDAAVKESLRTKFMWWAPIYTVRRNELFKTTNLYVRNAVMSRDGRCAYISTYDVQTHQSQLIRVNGFEKVNFNQYPADTKRQMNADADSTKRVLRDTKFTHANSEWFSRPISSIAVDPRPGKDRIVVTFEDYSDGNANVLIIDNASSENWTANATFKPITGFANVPAYCAMIEDSTGNIYVGTEEGLFILENNTWKQSEYLRGVAVTSITQQIMKLPVRRAITHTGINENKYLFAKTKWPRAIYYGTYGRGIFIDMTYVTDTVNEVSDPEDYNPVNIPTVEGNSASSVSIYPNPVMGEANLQLDAIEAGQAVLRIYDLNGRLVAERQLGHVDEGEHIYTIGTEGIAKGMYLVNVIIGGHTAATKMIVR